MNQLRINSGNQIHFFRSYMSTFMTLIHLKNHDGSLFLNKDFQLQNYLDSISLQNIEVLLSY